MSSKRPDSAKPELKNSFARHIKIARKTFDRAGHTALKHTHKLILDRLDNLRLVRRDVAIWLLLMAALIATGTMQALLFSRNLQTVAAADGGIYAEGVVDKITTINPLFATTDSEKTASQLVYSSLLDYDSTNHLRGDLALSWLSSDGKTWDIKLRENARWSDGQKLTADDVIFTVNLMKSQVVGSPLTSSWAAVKIAKVNQYEVKFTLANAYMSFPFALTFGILPEHILANIAPAEIRNFVSLNLAKIVGSGPFMYSSTETLSNGQTVWHFTPNAEYYGAKPRIAALTIRTYSDDNSLANGLADGEINAAAGLDVTTAAAEQPKANRQLVQAPLSDGVFILFNNSAPITSDKAVREALRLGTDRSALRQASVKGNLEIPEALETPIANGIYSSVDSLKQPAYDIKAAAAALDAAGWKIGKSGFREKDGQTLTLNIVTIRGANYEPVAQALAKQWQKLGINAQVTTADPTTAQQNYLMPRSYDVLVYQLHLGVDPDEYAYWSSSQTLATGLNFANYNSRRADLALSAGRTQTDPTAREARYNDFVKQWLADVPAIALYQPNYYYVSVSPLVTLDNTPLVDATNRFRDISNWTVKTAAVNVTP